MKKIFLFFAITLSAFTSCSDPKLELYDSANGQIAYYTSGTSSEFYVQDTPNSVTQIEVGVTVASNVDRIIAISIDESSTATPDQYSIDEASLVIPANSYVGYIKVKGFYEKVFITPSRLVINLDSVGGAVVAGFDNKYDLDLFQFCPFVRDEFLGTYKVTEYNPDGSVADSYDSEVTTGDEPNQIIMSNLYNGDSGSQTILIMDDSDTSSFKIEFPSFLENYLFYGGEENGDVFVEGFTGKFSACLKTLDFTYRLRFGSDNTGSSMTETYRVRAVQQ